MQNNQPKESLSIRVGLSGTYWDKHPVCSVLFNQTTIEKNLTLDESIRYIDFTVDVDEGTINALRIRLENKEDSDTVQNDDETAIIKDMLLNIESIEIDGIDIGQLKWDASTFVPDNTDRPVLKNCINLGWNGTYIFEFTSPFYLWLLENI